MANKEILFVLVLFCLLASGCADFSAHPLFAARGEKVDCGNGMRMMSYELCRLDSSGY